MGITEGYRAFLCNFHSIKAVSDWTDQNPEFYLVEQIISDGFYLLIRSIRADDLLLRWNALVTIFESLTEVVSVRFCACNLFPASEICWHAVLIMSWQTVKILISCPSDSYYFFKAWITGVMLNPKRCIRSGENLMLFLWTEDQFVLQYTKRTRVKSKFFLTTTSCSGEASGFR